MVTFPRFFKTVLQMPQPARCVEQMAALSPKLKLHAKAAQLGSGSFFIYLFIIIVIIFFGSTLLRSLM